MKNPKTVIQTIFAALFLLLVCSANGQQVWQRGYPGTEAQEANVVNTPDGGFLFSSDGQKAAIKTDADGNEQWSFSLPDSFDVNLSGSVAVHPDGSYVVVGGAYIQSPTFRSYDFAAKLGPTGNVIWFKTYAGTGGFYGQSVAVAADGGLYIGNQYNSLIKTDANGNLQWQNPIFYVEELVATADGGAIVLSYDYLFSDPNVYIYKVSSSGNVLWNKSYSLPSNQGFVVRGMAGTSDGGFAITGAATIIGNSSPFADLVVQKYDADGNQQWSQVSGTTGTLVGENIAQTQDGGYIVTGWQAGRYVWLWRLGPQGNQLWDKGYFVGEGMSVKEVPAGGFIMLARRLAGDPLLALQNGLRLVRTDAQGNVFENQIKGSLAEDLNEDCLHQTGEQGLAGWTVHATGPVTMYDVTDANGYFELAVDTGNYQLSFWPPQDYHQPCQPGLAANFTTAPSIIDLGTLPVLAVDTAIVTVSGPVFQDLDGDCEYDLGEPLLPNVQVGIRSEAGTTELYQFSDANGQYNFQVPAGQYYAVYIAASPDNPYCVPCCIDFCNFNYLAGAPVTYDLGMTCTIPQPASLTGFVFFDENENCLLDAGETGLDGWVIDAVQSGTTDTFQIDADNFTSSQFSVQVEAGNYFLTIIPANYLYLPCQFIQTVTVAPGGAPTVFFPLMTLTACPKLRVDVGVAGLRPCFGTTYFVNYCNEGTATAADAFVEITFPPSLSVNASQIPGLELPGNVWQFQLGDLPKDTCGSFSINTFLSCADSVGLTYCVTAHIFPDSICGPQSTQWDGSSVELSAECVGDSVLLTIANAGWGDMAQALEFIVVEDNVLIRDSTFQLPAGASTSLAVYPNGATIVLSSQQAANHPDMSMPIVFVEGCGEDSISLGFVTQYPQNDADCFVAIDCRESTASFDPNIKEAQPKGVTDAHYIENTTDLTYQITFQNLGTAAAETVVILDTLSQFLDTARLQLGAASHPYTFEMVSPYVLKVTFENIQLPHAAADFDNSIGFVKFRINQKPGNTPGIVIENRAGIYFDFNAPVITNTVTHRIPAPELFASQTVTLCPGESWQGLTLTSDTVLVDTVRYAFFDSIFSTHLQVLPLATGLLTETLCLDESITVNGTLYNEANPTGTELLPGASVNSCDSLVHVALAFWPIAASEFSVTVCEGTTVPFQDTLLSQSGTYEAHLLTVNGCDSLVTLHLEVLPVYEEELQVELPVGGSYHGITVFQDTIFTVVLEAANGCDSVVTVTVDILTKTVEGAALLDHLSVSPNPNRGDFVLRGQLRTGGYCKARLLDAWGREVASLFVEQWFAGDFTWPVQVDNLPSGLYYLEFSTTEGRTIRRMAVMR